MHRVFETFGEQKQRAAACRAEHITSHHIISPRPRHRNVYDMRYAPAAGCECVCVIIYAEHANDCDMHTHAAVLFIFVRYSRARECFPYRELSAWPLRTNDRYYECVAVAG